MEKFARSGIGDAPGSALLDCREVGISEQSYYRWRNEYGAHQKGLLRCTFVTAVDMASSRTAEKSRFCLQGLPQPEATLRSHGIECQD